MRRGIPLMEPLLVQSASLAIVICSVCWIMRK